MVVVLMITLTLHKGCTWRDTGNRHRLCCTSIGVRDFLQPWLRRIQRKDLKSKLTTYHFPAFLGNVKGPGWQPRLLLAWRLENVEPGRKHMNKFPLDKRKGTEK